ncbi:MAG: 2-hydroxymuconate tautomerase family protein [Synergistaceae bacterium]|jgi:4-oxalocrotonate tautomerase|nr:2-hydroxymuconate tautomerase family protein [Synergistaceae bacterium]
MPIIQVNLLQGRTTEAKREFVNGVTQLTCSCFGVNAEQVRVIFNEMSRENYAIAGTLVADSGKNSGP